jgi:hypothetical protein
MEGTAKGSHLRGAGSLGDGITTVW